MCDNPRKPCHLLHFASRVARKRTFGSPSAAGRRRHPHPHRALGDLGEAGADLVGAHLLGATHACHPPPGREVDSDAHLVEVDDRLVSQVELVPAPRQQLGLAGQGQGQGQGGSLAWNCES